MKLTRVDSPIVILIRNHWLKLITRVITLGLIGVVVWIGWQYRAVLWEYLQQANYIFLVRALAVYCIALFFSILGWHLLVRRFAPEIKWQTNLIIFCYTLASRRLPGTLWYVGGRMAFYRQIGVSQKAVATASGIEWIVTLAGGGISGLGLILFGVKFAPVVQALLAIAAIGGTLLVWPPILSRLLSLLKLPSEVPIHWRDTLAWFCVYTGTLLSGGLYASQVAGAFQALGPGEILFTTGAWISASTAGLVTVFLPSSFGVTEISLAALLASIMPLPLAGFIAVFLRLATTIAEILISLISYPFVRRRFAI